MEKGRSGLCERDSESGWEKREGFLCVCVCFGLLVLIFKIFLNLIFLMWTIFKVFIEFVNLVWAAKQALGKAALGALCA